MAYKYQGFGAGPTTRVQMIGLIAVLIVVSAVYVTVAWLVWP